MGVAYGGQDAALRTLLAYRQDEESSADQAAVTFLNATKQSGRGHAGDASSSWRAKLIGVQGINPYLQTHPLPQQRIVQLSELWSRRAPTTTMSTRLSCSSGTT